MLIKLVLTLIVVLPDIVSAQEVTPCQFSYECEMLRSKSFLCIRDTCREYETCKENGECPQPEFNVCVNVTHHQNEFSDPVVEKCLIKADYGQECFGDIQCSSRSDKLICRMHLKKPVCGCKRGLVFDRIKKECVKKECQGKSDCPYQVECTEDASGNTSCRKPVKCDMRDPKPCSDGECIETESDGHICIPTAKHGEQCTLNEQCKRHDFKSECQGTLDGKFTCGCEHLSEFDSKKEKCIRYECRTDRDCKYDSRCLFDTANDKHTCQPRPECREDSDCTGDTGTKCLLVNGMEQKRCLRPLKWADECDLNSDECKFFDPNSKCFMRPESDRKARCFCIEGYTYQKIFDRCVPAGYCEEDEHCPSQDSYCSDHSCIQKTVCKDDADCIAWGVLGSKCTKNHLGENRCLTKKHLGQSCDSNEECIMSDPLTTCLDEWASGNPTCVCVAPAVSVTGKCVNRCKNDLECPEGVCHVDTQQCIEVNAGEVSAGFVNRAYLITLLVPILVAHLLH